MSRHRVGTLGGRDPPPPPWIAKSKADLEELIDIAALLADHCPPDPGTSAAKLSDA